MLVAKKWKELPSGTVIKLCKDNGSDAPSKHNLNDTDPRTAMAVFNSPFGPRILVATDRLSEGVDLHRYCRHLIHYELSPSPMRVIQRNGRIRRINSWAARLNKPINIYYPCFKGTRDERLVAIMKERLDSFDALLGGVGARISDDVLDDTGKDISKRLKETLAKVINKREYSLTVSYKK